MFTRLMLKLTECEESVTRGSATFTRTKALPVFSPPSLSLHLRLHGAFLRGFAGRFVTSATRT